MRAKVRLEQHEQAEEGRKLPRRVPTGGRPPPPPPEPLGPPPGHEAARDTEGDLNVEPCDGADYVGADDEDGVGECVVPEMEEPGAAPDPPDRGN